MRIVFTLIVLLTGLMATLARGAEGLELKGQLGGMHSAVAIRGNYAYVGEGCAIDVLELTDPAAPRRVGRVILESQVDNLDITGQTLCVRSSYLSTSMFVARFEIFDISDPIHPVRQSYLGYDYLPFVNIEFHGENLLYIARANSIMVVDISDPAHRTLVQEVPVPDLCGLSRQGAYLYATAESKLYVFAIDAAGRLEERASYPAPWSSVRNFKTSGSMGLVHDRFNSIFYVLSLDNPASPTIAAQFADPYSTDYLELCGTTAVLVDYTSRGNPQGWLRTLDLSTPTSPTLLGSDVFAKDDQTFWSGFLKVIGQHAWLSDRNGYRIVDLADPRQPQACGSYPIPFAECTDLTLAGNLALVASDRGLMIFDVSDMVQPVLRSQLTAMGYDGAHVLDHRILAKRHNVEQTDVIDLRDPDRPQLLGSLPLRAGRNKFEVYGSYAFLVSGIDRLVILDASSPTTLTIKCQYPIPPSPTAMTLHYPWVYTTNGQGKLNAINCADLTSPTLASVCQLHTELEHTNVFMMTSGNRLLVFANRQVGVFDLTRPEAPALVQLANFHEFNIEYQNPARQGTRTCGVRLFSNVLRLTEFKNPLSPVLRGQLALPMPPEAVALDGANVGVIFKGEGGVGLLKAADYRNACRDWLGY